MDIDSQPNLRIFIAHARLNGSGTLQFVLRWDKTIKIDLLYMLFVDKSSGASVSVCLNPEVKEFRSSLDFHTGTSINVIHVYGLVTRETESGRFYQLSGYSKRKLKVMEKNLADLIVIFNIKETLVIKLPLKDKVENNLEITMVRCPPASYTVMTDTTFNSVATFVIFLKQLHQTFVFIVNTTRLKLSLPVALETGTWGDIQVLCISSQDSSTNKHMIASTKCHSEKIPFKTYLSTDDHRKLYTLALSYINSKKKPKIQVVEHFYRNKSAKYFHDIIASPSGEMQPYLKDRNGDQGSVINGAINGLFFGTFLSSKSKPPPVSFYGPCRIHLQANKLFTENCNVYFSDFYCHYEQHYVTIVMTHSGSPEDTFCNQYLLQLDKYDNPFVKLLPTNNVSHCVMVSMSVVVEIFYTESVNIRSLLQNGHGFMSTSIVMGRGESKPDGIPKNDDCSKCNLASWKLKT